MESADSQEQRYGCQLSLFCHFGAAGGRRVYRARAGVAGSRDRGRYSEEEALANAEEAIRAVLSYRQDQGIPIPADAHPEIRQVSVAA